ncbi:uncharacterized protein LOC144133438 [Amblyomma americanum]|uniref:Uncharacterized protein n=1 Tax=Amblyomma americanum TaxID=6943 RepID=A0AAQ4F6Q1_AMBAM
MWILRKRLYRLVRRVFPSLEYADHETIRRRLSYIYAVAAFQGFIALLVVVFRKHAPSEGSGIDYAKFLAGAQKDAKSATIISIRGTTVARQELSEEELISIRKQKEEIYKKSDAEAS